MEEIKEVDLSMVVAMTPKRVIGNKGELPWRRLPGDLSHFRNITMRAGSMIMGYTTYISIIKRNNEPLPGRKHIVLTRRHRQKPFMPGPVVFVGSPEEALAEVATNGQRACVIGGGEIYNLFLSFPQVKKVYITTVYAPWYVSGDAYFPKMDFGDEKPPWRCIGCSSARKWDPRDEYVTSRETYERSP